MNDREQHQACTEKFITLANSMREEGINIQLINAALMAASGVYATYTAGGNEGALEPSGIEKVVAIYRKNLEYIQQRKKADLAGGNA